MKLTLPLPRRGWPAALMLAVAVLAGCGQKSPEELIEQAKAMMQSRDIYGAELIFQKIIATYPESREAVYARTGLVECYRQTKDYESAHAQVDELLGLFGGAQSVDGYNTLMLKIRLLGDEQKLGEAIRLVKETSPTLVNAEPDIRFHLATVLTDLYAMNGQMAEAQQLAARLPAGAGGDPEMETDALRKIEATHARPEDRAGLLKIYQDYLADYPDSIFRPDVTFAIGQIDRLEGREEEAARMYDAAEAMLRESIEKALGAEAKSAGMLKLSGMYQFRGKIEPSRELLNQVIEDYAGMPISGQALLHLASLDYATGRTEDCALHCKRVIAEFPESALSQQAAKMLQNLSQMAMAAPTSATQTMDAAAAAAAMATAEPMATAEAIATTEPMAAMDATATSPAAATAGP
jgi:outer membrane protein assembly factor BamD (BamD/ComL family)